VTVSGNGQLVKPPLHPIPVQRPFQILGVDVMDLAITEEGNKHLVVFKTTSQCISSTWPEGNAFSSTSDQGSNSFLQSARGPVI